MANAKAASPGHGLASSPYPVSGSSDGSKANSEQHDHGSEHHPRAGMKSFAWPLVLISILCSHFLYALDNTVVANVQPAIIATLGEIDKLPWISVGFVFAAASVTLTWGRLYGLFDVKITFMTAVFVFEVGTAVCGAAPTMNAFIVGRTICGLGAGGIYTGTMVVVAAFTSIKERPAYLGMTGLTWGFGTVLGPVIGGAFADNTHATWRWGFYIGLCVGAVAAPVYFLLLPRYDVRKGTPMLIRFFEFDLVGSVLLIGAFVSGTCAIDFGGSLYAWSDSRIIGLFCVFGVLCILFTAQQGCSILTKPEHRLFPGDMLKSRDMVILFIQASASNACVFIPVFYIPLYFQFVRGDGALESAVRLLPYVCVFVAAAMFNGIFMTKTGYYLPWYIVGAALSLVGGALMFTVTQHTAPSRVYGYSVLIAAGAGSVNPACWAVSQAKAPRGNFVQASAFIGLANALGLTLTLSISNSVFVNVATKMVATVLPRLNRTQVQAAIAGTDAHVFQTLMDDERMRCLDAITYALSRIYIMLIVGAATSLVFAMLMKWEKVFVDPEKEQQDEQKAQV
ncbi:hypothetical protein EPUS_06510 [Endocarpon pusillum Z07020]|uniref:Major facilitator superfamily (MFS) profile domain-containing protein n=1 Tax=Endocarpon pusillum (strain Z07020 / HMAS-L-300199) TaxID=1263415 RepID=U1GJD5_ENDPU|nr:uncharacterized protein EPUS_06510 [Endocarpon pusillum Z07020]ERF71951.1 hypothetical protein EPUS_06510 [Endocarpon pusillum Z07020]